MSWEVHLSAFASNDASEAYEWYESKVEGLGNDFLAEIEVALEKLRKSALNYVVVFDEFRRIPIKRFPYGIYFEVHGDRVEVFAIYHAKRDFLQLRSRK